MFGNGGDDSDVLILADDASGEWLTDPVVLVVSRAALKAFLDALDNEWLGPQQDFFKQLKAAVDKE